MYVEGKRILVTGGTGSLGQTVIRRLLTGEIGQPARVIVFSRDEAKQHAMRLAYKQHRAATEEVIFDRAERILDFHIGDIRSYRSISSIINNVDIVINAAALKQVPTCEYFPYEAVLTNIVGVQNIVRAIQEHNAFVETVISISTDKACKPVNVMGMTKAIQERILVEANVDYPDTRFICARYGNVLASRGSVIPLFQDQISHGGPVTITTPDMTRFLLTLNQAVDTIFVSLQKANGGEIYVPRIPSAKVIDIANAMIAGRGIKKQFIGIRPGEKIHEILVSEEEASRTISRDGYYVILPMLPELQAAKTTQALDREYSSADNPVNEEDVRALLDGENLLEF